LASTLAATLTSTSTSQQPQPRIDLSPNGGLDPVARALLENAVLDLNNCLVLFITRTLKEGAAFAVVVLCVVVKSDCGEAGKPSGRLALT
jgi:hypothetical protein